MRSKPVKAGGITRGRVPVNPEPPPPLPVVDMTPAKRVGSHGLTVDQVVQALAGAFVKAVGERGARELLRRMDDEWRHVLRLMASDLIDEGIAPAAYVAFVVGRARRAGPVFAGQVFSLKYFPTWLAQYRTAGGALVNVPGYRATPARRRAHFNRVRACQATS